MKKKRPPKPKFEETFVSYYLDGWRHGYLIDIVGNGNTAIIRPVAGYRAAVPRPIRVPMTDVRQDQPKGDV